MVINDYTESLPVNTFLSYCPFPYVLTWKNFFACARRLNWEYVPRAWIGICVSFLHVKCVCGWPTGELLLNGSLSERSSFTEEWHASLALLLALFFPFPTLYSLTRLHLLTVLTSSRVASHVCHSLACFLPFVSVSLHMIILFISYMSSLSFSNSPTITLYVHFKRWLISMK